MKKTNWKLWTDYVETGIGEIDLNDNNSTTQWKTFLNLLLDASEKYIPLKTISRHSKPFWNSELTKSSEELRHLRRKFKYCSNYINGEKLVRTKESFKKQLSDSASKWMKCFLSNLGQKRGRDIWASYKRLLNKKKEEVGLIRNKVVNFFTRKAKFVHNLKQPFSPVNISPNNLTTKGSLKMSNRKSECRQQRWTQKWSLCRPTQTWKS